MAKYRDYQAGMRERQTDTERQTARERERERERERTLHNETEGGNVSE